MKRILCLFSLLFCLVSCQQKLNRVADGYSAFGEVIDPLNAADISALNEKFSTMSPGDSMEIKLVAKVEEVCQEKGCWMKLDLGEGKQLMVRFRDYGFFVPGDIKGSTVVVNGKAFIDEMSVEDQKHYAEDAGKPESEISAITERAKTHSFIADGVLLKN